MDHESTFRWCSHLLECTVKAAFLCIALAAAPVFADELVARQGNDSIRLAEAPCASTQVLSQLQPQQREEYRAASAVVQGTTYTACWRVMGNAAHLLYEDGDQGIIPLAELKRELSA
jgi:hypothetical protein